MSDERRSPRDHPDFKEYRRLRFAESDWMEARAALDMLNEVDRDTDCLRLRERALHAALGVCYARPFSDNRRDVDPLDWDDWAPKDTKLRDLHRKLIKMRMTVWAHSDGNRRFRDVLLIQDGDDAVWGVKWTSLTPLERRKAAKLLDDQRARAKCEAEKVEPPTSPW